MVAIDKGRFGSSWAKVALAVVLTAVSVAGQHQVSVVSHRIILGQDVGTEDEGGFGISLAGVGDLNGDGLDDLIVGEPFSPIGGTNGFGRAWLIAPTATGVAKAIVQMPPHVQDAWQGAAVAEAADLDGNGLVDFVVVSPGDAHEWLWHQLTGPGLSVAGTLQSRHASFLGGNAGPYGHSVALLEVDGTPLLSGGDPIYAVGGRNLVHGFGSNQLTGAVWLSTDNGDINLQAIGFGGDLAPGDGFGDAVEGLGDIDGNGVPDLVVGAPLTHGALQDEGALYVIRLAKNPLSVIGTQLISTGTFGLPELGSGAGFGYEIVSVGDLDGNGQDDLAIAGDDQVWLAFLRLAGPVASPTVEIVELREIALPAGITVRGDRHGLGFLGDRDGPGPGTLTLACGATLGQPSDIRGTIVLLDIEVSPGAWEHWEDLGHCLAGVMGCPVLAGSGDLVGGGLVALDLSNARPAAPAYLIVGPEAWNFTPFFGGTLVPDFTVSPGLILALMTDARGEVVLSGTWPTGVPTGFEVYLQYWISDPSGPFGYSASNAVKGTAP